MVSAQHSMPWYAKESLFGARGLTVLVTALCLWMVDRLVLVPLKLKGRYFILHAAGNAIAVVLTFNGMLRTLMDPVHAAVLKPATPSSPDRQLRTCSPDPEQTQTQTLNPQPGLSSSSRWSPLEGARPDGI